MEVGEVEDDNNIIKKLLLEVDKLENQENNFQIFPLKVLLFNACEHTLEFRPDGNKK